MNRTLALSAALLIPLAGLTLPAAAQSPATPSSAAPSSQDPPKPASQRPPARPVVVAAHPPPLILNIQPPPSASGYSPAPVPNLDIAGPAAAPRVGPEFSGSLTGPRDTSTVSNGYTDGSQYSTDLERHRSGVASSFAPTLSLKIPFIYANSNQVQQ